MPAVTRYGYCPIHGKIKCDSTTVFLPHGWKNGACKRAVAGRSCDVPFPETADVPVPGSLAWICRDTCGLPIFDNRDDLIKYCNTHGIVGVNKIFLDKKLFERIENNLVAE
jgi:hypothetical protein